MEFTGVPESMFSESKPYRNQKSALLDYISVTKAAAAEVFAPGSKIGLVIDLSVIVRAHAAFISTDGKYFGDFVKRILRGIASLGTEAKADRIDIVADLYEPFSIKATTRLERGAGQQMIFKGNSELPNDIASFLHNDKNKMDLNMLIAEHAMRPQSWVWKKDVVVSYNRKVLTNYDGIQEIYSWTESVHEEADNRMIVHIKNMLENGTLQMYKYVLLIQMLSSYCCHSWYNSVKSVMVSDCQNCGRFWYW